MQSSKGRTALSLSFSNHLIKLQSLPAIQHDIETAVKQNGSPLDIKHPQLSLLVDGLNSSSPSTVTSCCVVLTSAVSPHHRWVESRSLLSLLITQAATANHYAIIVDTIGRILVDEMEATSRKEENYQCPYSLRTNVHPFISVLNSRPESGLCIVDKTVAILREHRMSSVVLKLLEPFIKYVLLSPSSTAEIVLVGNYLHSQLVTLAKTFLSSSDTASASGGSQFGVVLVKLLLKLVPLQPVKTDAQMLTVVCMVNQLVGLQVEVNIYDLGLDLIDVCLSLVCELTNRGLPITMLLESTVKIVSTKTTLAVHHFLAISWLLLNHLLDPSIVKTLLRLCKSSRDLSSFLTFPLIQLLSQPTSTLSLFGSHDQISSNQKTAASLLKSCVASSDAGEVVEMTAPIASCSGQYSLLVATAQEYVSIIAHPDRVISWLTSLTKNLAGSKSLSGASDHLVVILTTILLKYCNTESSDRLIESSLQALCSIAKIDPTTSPSILPFFLYLTSVMTRPTSKLTLLYSIPLLATHKLASIAVSNTVITLGKTPSLLPIATRLIVKAWQLQDHLFPLVKEFLSRPLPSTLTETLTTEVALARATVIKDICLTKAEQHGEEMLSVISIVLSSGSHDPLPVAMVIKGLVSLCNADVIDVVTLWGVIEGDRGRLSLDSRPVVVQSLCQLLELAAELDTETRHSNKSFKATALKLLWRFALSQEHHCSSAAWKALKSFQLDDFLLDYLPVQVNAQLRQGQQQEESKEQDPTVPAPVIMTGSQCVQLLQWVPLESLDDYSDFLSSLLQEEVKGIGRGVVYSALREAQMTSQFERLLESTIESLPDVCAAYTQRDTTPAGLNNATLMSVYGRTTKDREGQSARRQHLNEHLKQLSVKLEVFLRDSRLSTHLTSDTGSANGLMGLSCLHLGKQWSLFTEALCDAYYRIRLLDTCSVSVQDDGATANPVFQEKLAEARIWSVDQVLGKLEEFVRRNTNSSSGVFMCLVGVASSAVRKVDSSNQTSAGRKYSQILSKLLFELLDCVLLVLGEGVNVSTTLPVLQTVMRTKQADLKTFAILSLPSIVEGVWLHCWDGETVTSKLVVLAKRLLDETAKHHVDWYVPVVLNQVLERILPLTPNVFFVLENLVSQADAASQAESLELLSTVSAFIPALCLHTSTIPVALKLVSSLQEKIHSLNDSMLTTATAQLCSLHFATGLITMFIAGHVSEDQGMTAVTVLAGLATKAPQVGIFHLSLSVVLFGLSGHGHKSAMALSDTIAAKWLQECDVEQSENEVLPPILGLVGLLGFNPVTYGSEKYGAVHVAFLKTLSPLVLSLLEKILVHSSDVVVSSSQWLTLQVYESVASVLNVTEKVPESYDYLPNNSILNHSYTLLESLSSSLSTGSGTLYLNTILSVFSKSDQLPPASFSKLMIPFVRCDETLQMRCIQCFVSNKDTLGFKQLATNYCTDLVFVSLPLGVQCSLLESLPVLLDSLSFVNLSRFLQLVIGPLSFHCLSQLKWVHSLLAGLQKTLKLDSLKPNYKHMIVTTVKNLYRVLCSHYEQKDKSSMLLMARSILQSMAGVLSLCGDCSALVGLSSGQDFESSVASIIHCCWVASGVKRFSTIEGVVEWLLRNIESPGIIHQFCWLINVVCELTGCCKGPQAIQLIQTDLLHMLLNWTRAHKPLKNQMKAVLILAVSCFHCTNTSHTVHWFSEDTKMMLEDIFASVTLPTLPESPVIREKLCQCLLEWLHLTNDTSICSYIIGLLVVMKSSQEYCKATVWTFVAHIL